MEASMSEIWYEEPTDIFNGIYAAEVCTPIGVRIVYGETPDDVRYNAAELVEWLGG